MNTSAPQNFPCLANCGLCCQSLAKNPAYRELDRGDGTCRHFDTASKRCTIYSQRPLLCRVDDFYTKFLQGKENNGECSRQEFYRQNLEACANLAREKAEWVLYARLQRQKNIL